MAYRGNIPRLWARTVFYAEGSSSRLEQNGPQNIDLHECPNWPANEGYSNWQYVCINLQSCLTTVVEGISHEVSRIWFDNTENSFWIDEFTVSQAQVSGECLSATETHSHRDSHPHIKKWSRNMQVGNVFSELRKTNITYWGTLNHSIMNGSNSLIPRPPLFCYPFAFTIMNKYRRGANK